MNHSPRSPSAARTSLHRNERGLALPLAILAVLLLAGLILMLAQLTANELDIDRYTRGDVRAQYLAQAGIEHQIYVLKGDKNGAALATPINFPASGSGQYRYSTSLTCLLNCTANRESRRWRIVSTGQIRRPNPGGGFTVIQTRAIRAVVEIAYSGTGADLYRFPTEVTILRWEEVYP
ncbi:MAG TPA: hypothetical protein VGR25_08925 [bacterium]|jgi:Tfp pilus assembly protein PilV|nr:hypothetical protein [bacterium]